MFRICSAVDVGGRRQCVQIFRNMLTWHDMTLSHATPTLTLRQFDWLSHAIEDQAVPPGGLVHVDQADPTILTQQVQQAGVVHCHRDGVDRFVFFCGQDRYEQGGLVGLKRRLMCSDGTAEEVLAMCVLSLLHATTRRPEPLQAIMSHYPDFTFDQYRDIDQACHSALADLVARTPSGFLIDRTVFFRGVFRGNRIDHAFTLLPTRGNVETMTRPGFTHINPFDDSPIETAFRNGPPLSETLGRAAGVNVARLASRGGDAGPCFKDY